MVCTLFQFTLVWVLLVKSIPCTCWFHHSNWAVLIPAHHIFLPCDIASYPDTQGNVWASVIDTLRPSFSLSVWKKKNSEPWRWCWIFLVFLYCKCLSITGRYRHCDAFILICFKFTCWCLAKTWHFKIYADMEQMTWSEIIIIYYYYYLTSYTFSLSSLI